MMINNKDNNNPDDSVKGDASAHLLIKDKKTGKVIRNQRG